MRKIFYLISFVVLVLVFVFAFTYYNKKSYFFQNDGYVIDTMTGSKQYFFDASEYKINSKGVVSFLNSSNETKSINDDTFVHYMDGSISVFKKSAVLDLNNMDQKSFQYYTVYAGSVFNKQGSDYKISYLNKQLSFSDFLIKISNNKYLIASMNLKIRVGETEQVVKSGYIELTFSDGNIIKLQNQEIDIQNISASIQVLVNDDIIINPANKKILYKDKEKLNLGEITIDSDDNIEIIQDEPAKINETNDSSNNNAGNNGNGNNNNGNKANNNDKKIIHQGDFDEVTSGIVDAAQIEIEKIVEDNAAIKDAVFTITEFDVTANSVLADISVTDEEAVLTGTLYIKIIKADTNEVVYYEQDNSGSSLIQIEVMTLSPETNYILILNRDYIKNEITYNKDFIQKTFVTKSLGIDVSKDYLRPDEASLNLIKHDYSKVSRVSYELFDNTTQEEIKSGEAEFNDSNKVNLDFLNLLSNHHYTITLHDFVYGNTIINSNSSNYYFAFDTLKTKPKTSTTTFSVDKKNSKFIIHLNNINDIDAGITSYRSDVYDNSTKQFVTSKTSSTNADIQFNVDGTLINRNTNYIVYTYLIFNDNEMEYELPLGSELVNVTGDEGPVVTFYSDEITWERIRGRIVIQDPNNTINTSSKIYVSYQNLSVGVEPLVEQYDISMSGDTGVIEFDKNNLRGSDTYLFTVKAYVDYHDGDGYSLVDIAKFNVQTGTPNKMTVQYVDKTEDNKKDSFYVECKLKNYSDDKPTELEAKSMKSIQFKLYSINYDKATECEASNGCWVQRYFDQNIDDNNDYNSSLKADYYDKTFKVTQDTLGVSTDQITYGQYYLEITGAYDYTDYKNDLPIVLDEPILISANNASGSITNKSIPVDVKTIYNNGTYDFLYDTTQIGFEVTANIISPVIINNIIYQIYSADNGNLIQEMNIASEDGSVPTAVFNLSNSQSDSLRRGASYFFKFIVNYTIDNDSMSEQSVNSMTFTTRKQEPLIEIYQSNRVGSNVYFNYRYKDIDSAVVGSKLYYYKNNDSKILNSINLVKTDNNDERVLEIPFTSGTLNGYVKRKLQPDLPEEKFDLIRFYFFDVISDIGNINYTIQDGNNVSYIVFNGLNDIQKRSIVGVDIKLTNSKSTLYLQNKMMDTEQKIAIPYASIKSLRSNNSSDIDYIEPTITVYYDTNIYGINATNLGKGFANQLINYTYLLFDTGFFAYNINSFDPVNKNISIKNVNNANNTMNLSYSLDNGYMVVNGEKVSVKQLNTKNAACNGSSDECHFWFSEIKPTIQISEDVGITTFGFGGEITGIDDSYLDSFKIFVDVYKCDDNSCVGAENVKSLLFTLDQFQNGETVITGLQKDTYYRVYYYWRNQSGNNNNFFFINSSDDNYFSQFKTSSSAGITGAYAYYRSSYVFNRRELVISYNVSITRGYDGVEYEIIYNNDENNLESAMDIPADDIATISANINNGRYVKSVDISNILEAGKLYYINIKPYYMNGTQKIYLNAINNIKFNFIIKNPTISISRTSDINENNFSIRVILKDLNNALAGANNYRVYASSNGVETFIGEAISGTASTFNDVTCSGDSCDIIVKYNADFKNNGEFVESSYSYNISLLSNIFIGRVAIVSIPDTSKIRVSFVDSYKLTSVNKIMYTIYDSDFNVVTSKDDFVPVWGESSPSIYVDLLENVPSGFYTLQLQLYCEDELVGNATLDYIKG